jgi:hypothetical protein
MGGRRFRKPVKKNPDNPTGNIPVPSPIVAEKKKHNGRDLVMAASGALAEYLATASGSYWLAWFAVALLFGAFYEYTKDALSRRSKVFRYAMRVIVVLVLLGGGLFLVKINKEKGLAAYFHFIYVGEVANVGGVQGKGSMVLFLVDMHNSGKPSIAENYRLSARLDNGTEISAIAPSLKKKWDLNRADGRKVGTIENSWLYDKTFDPIPTGGMACGWLMFFLPDVPYDNVKKGQMTTWTLSFADVDATRRKANLHTSMEGLCCEKSPHDDPCVKEQLAWAAMEN